MDYDKTIDLEKEFDQKKKNMKKNQLNKKLKNLIIKLNIEQLY